MSPPTQSEKKNLVQTLSCPLLRPMFRILVLMGDAGFGFSFFRRCRVVLMGYADLGFMFFKRWSPWLVLIDNTDFSIMFLNQWSPR